MFEAIKSFLSDLKAAIRGVFATETAAMEESIRQCEGIVDHRDIWDAYDRIGSIDSDALDANGAMVGFMRRARTKKTAENRCLF
ncbi:MAG: hypothetical protein IJF24_00995 [Clostridia bacterium]|nr:hypothetical protein [Clostridia bacterium]